MPSTTHSRSRLRFLTCGSVDDGKSTLIGRLLHDTGSLTEDQHAQLLRHSAQYGTCGSNPDYALLLDGLIAEIKRHPAMLIDRYPAVAWRKRIASRRLFVKLRPDRHYAPDWIQAARELLESAFY